MARKKGDITGSGANRRRWDGRRWVPAPVGSPARNTSTRTRAQNRRSSLNTSNTTRTSNTTKPKTKEQIRAEALARTSYTVSGVEYWRDTGKAKDKPGGFSSPNGYSIDPKTGKRTNGIKAPAEAPKPTPKPTPTPKPKPKPKPKPTPRAASASNAQDLRRGRTPDTPSTSSTPPKKKYGVKDGNSAKGRTKRLTDALNNLKVRKY